MEGYMDKVIRSFADQRVQLTATAIVASAFTASVLLGSQQIKRKRRSRKLKQDSIKRVPIDEHNAFDDYLHKALAGNEQTNSENSGEAHSIVTKHTPIEVSPNEESLIREQLARHYAFLGEEGMNKLRDSFVVVVGAGGVGSWAALMLLRSGVQRLRVIDFDQVTLSSLNRHAVATRANVGIPKVEALRQHFAEIAPHVKVDSRVALFKSENASQLLSGEPDYVLDCIDNMDTKVDLIAYCKANGLEVISAMGAGMKSDPSRVQIADISDTFEDPMSRTVRRKIKKIGIESGVKVVYSTEKPGKVQLVSLAESQQENPGDFSVLPDFRVRIVPVLGTLPAMFGIAMGTHVLTELSGFPTEPLAIKGRHALYARLQRDLGNREVRLSGKNNGALLQMSTDDCGYILEEIWHGKSALSGATDKLALVRWRRDQPMATYNCICLTKAEAAAHEKVEGDPEKHYNEDAVKYISRRLETERQLSKWR